MEDTLCNEYRVCGTNSWKRGARVGPIDSRKDFQGKVTLP